KGVVFMGIAGEDGGSALADIIVGNVCPSGKLAFTIAERYEDYPSARDFSFDKDNPLTYESYGLDPKENGSTGFDKSPVAVYREGIYTGYRYFDAFGVKPLFPFGYGLSYTEFSIRHIKTEKSKGILSVIVEVTNIGSTAGYETVQIYVYPKNTASEQPLKKLWGFEKTKLLAAGEGETLKIALPLRELAVYEEERAAWVIEKGVYLLNIGGNIKVTEDISVEQCENRLSLKQSNRERISFLRHKSERADVPSCEITVSKEDISTDYAAFSETAFDFSKFKLKELAALCVGYGPGIPFSAFCKEEFPNTLYDENGCPLAKNDRPAGRLGYVSPAIPKYGIHSAHYSDGPAGVGKTVFPCEMLIACSFDRKLWYRFGNAVGKECEERGVDIWLAPAVNLHRNPLCGRNFEYFSEDPLLTGICAAEIINGLQKNHPVLACPKHFAANEQETYRRGSAKSNYDAVDSVLEERVLREIYLKPFEMSVKNANIACIMTSFNKINGILSAGNSDLCTRILRKEWGFRGAVVSDWGDMDTVVDGAEAVKAGNDIVMPGGPPVIEQILKGLENGRLVRSDLERAVSHLLVMLKRLEKYEKTE
ncbi:MAG: fibronectin type III-like domain-contianing protein, partial [Firmicutes bacterium]|nr:fibronectin type III-like domain-contianing protein [Bacillota bacterium]